jgi:3' exoribonuclease, RNase T-like
MVDLETLAKAPHSVILSLGACVFDNASVKDNIYFEASMESQMNDHVIDIETLKWWDKQETPTPMHGTIPLQNVVGSFNEWLVKVTNGNVEDLIIWCKGTDFDLPMLEFNLQKYGYNVLWKYNHKRDFRTVLKTFGRDTVYPSYKGHSHNALDDAINQAHHLVAILQTHHLVLE